MAVDHVAQPVGAAPDVDPIDLLDDAVVEDVDQLEGWGGARDNLDQLADLWAAEADLESALGPPQAGGDVAAAAEDEVPADVAPIVEAAQDDVLPSNGELWAAPTAAEPIDPVAEQWSALVAQAAELDFVVQTRYAGASGVDLQTRTIHIAFDQPPHTRVVDLVGKLVEVAVQRTPVEAIPADLLPRQRSEEAAPIAPEPVASEFDLPRASTRSDEGSEWVPMTNTPLYEQMQRDLGLADLVEPNGHAAPADGGTTERDTPLYEQLRRDLGLADLLEPNGQAAPADGETPEVRTSAPPEMSGQRDIQDRAGVSAEAAVETPARKERTGLPGARPATAGSGVARPTGDPVVTSRSRHNR
ncbi:hypothetical protein [Actinokineospora enzanensis]|uniref:hypothetical protein n=1 Tax=Actinokineospora enzanensis TaxID=155975 RepID=UPI00039D8930|nr:hypothetical protein [Actinokineospora enzanensis]